MRTCGEHSRTTSKTVAGDTTQYVLGLAATLPVVISDTEAVYLYGLDILGQQQSERLYYVHDGLGSVRQLVDTTGQIETNYAYDPFDVPQVGGDVSNPYRFTGEAWDAEVELLYLRARYYQPEVGRFITKDQWPGDHQRPGSLNGYAYAANNPVNYTDPSGQTRRPPYDVFAPYPYDISALQLGWLWASEQSPEYMVFDERWALTRQLMHDQGVNQARMQFYQELQAGTLENGRDYYGYRYVPINYFREAAEYLVGYDRVGFFLGSYVVYTRLNSDEGTVTFAVVDPKNLQTFTKSPCYYAPDFIGPIVNSFGPESLQLQRSAHSLEALIMKTQQFDFPSDVFLVSLFEPRYRSDPGVFGSDIRFGGWTLLRFTWTEPLQPDRGG